ncbi:hypothetical protein C8Q74DRAFT_1310917 [Fomes fomentarius]|nr:hypothetical protein C8Q74DRAFT_1310917 [Fomes fomentarius]
MEREMTLQRTEKAVSRREAAVKKDKNTSNTGRAEQVLLKGKIRNLQTELHSLKVERGDLVKLCEDKDTEIARMSSSLDETGVNLQWILGHLDDQYQCSLAEPYLLDNTLCGHTFCAICVLKWASARIDLECGYWHEALECPLCRALLPYTPYNAPRNTHTFPFIPNHIADASIKSLLTILKEAAGSKTAVTGVARSGTWHGKVDGEVIPWGEGKSARVEWENRARIGKREMTLLVSNWTALQPEDFITIKDRLEKA